VFGTKYGLTFSLVWVRGSKAYAKPMKLSSDYFSPMNARLNGMFGPVQRGFSGSTTVLWLEKIPIETLTIGIPWLAGNGEE